jgi:hypothetical protein
MKSMPLALVVALAAAQPAFADETAGEPAPEAVAEADIETGVETAAAAAFTVDMPIEALMADERSKAVLETHLPGIGDYPAYDQFKAMSLVQVMPWSQGMITEDVLATIAADLAAIEPPAEA